MTLYDLFDFSMPGGAPSLPSTTRPLATARPYHAHPTQQPLVSPANERAPSPNSANGGHGKARSLGRGRIGGEEGVSYIFENISLPGSLPG